MNLFQCFAAPGYHTSIVTTFGVDFDAYESIVLPRLREAGCNNNILIADARMLGQAMGESFRRPKFAGRRYSVVGVQPAGVFHPKIILQLGKTSGRLLVASANMTAAGLAGNLEVVGEVKSDENDRDAVPVLRAALEYLARFLSDTSVPRRQVDWAMKRAQWLAESTPGEATVELKQGGVLAFLGSGAEESIGAKFIDLVGKRPVKRFIAISPYWDSHLNALRAFKQHLSPKRMAVLVQPRSALFPVHHWPVVAGANLFDIAQIKGTGASRFAHAKVFIAETSTGDCVLFGSANCTEAALGGQNSAGVNEEACLYRELRPGQAVKLLGLEHALVESTAIEASALPSFKPGGEIPMSDLVRRLPGRFELSSAFLRWWPPVGLDASNAEILLFDNTGARLFARLTRIDSSVDPISYQCEFNEPPHFAIVRTGDFESSLAIIIVELAIQEAQRRSKSRGVENALAMLDDEAAFEGLWLLEVIQKLDAAEQELQASSEESKLSQRKSINEKDEGTSRRLTYEQFIAGRQNSGSGGRPANSHLGASHQESVRRFLNALIGQRRSLAFDGMNEEQVSVMNWSLGDETADGDQALDHDYRFGSDTQVTITSTEISKQRLRRQQQYVKDTQTSLAKGVERFLSILRDEVSERHLGVVDLLRLRVLLMVILGAGSKMTNVLTMELNAEAYRPQVLPSSGDASWTRLVGRLLYEFFDKPKPLIEQVVLDVQSDEGLPEDILECWATCYWALCSMRVFVNETGASVMLNDVSSRLAMSLYRYTRLLSDNALSEVVQGVFAGMSSRYGERLGADDAAVRTEHERLVAQAHQRGSALR